MFHIKLAAAVSALAVALVSVPGAAAADTPRLISTSESDCYEVPVVRAAFTKPLRQLVPERYGLLRLGDTASRMLITTYTCTAVSVDDQPVIGGDQPTTVSIGSAAITSRDGIPTSGFYVLWYATDNPVLFAKLQQSGLPVAFLPRTENTLEPAVTTSGLTWTIRGARPGLRPAGVGHRATGHHHGV